MKKAEKIYLVIGVFIALLLKIFYFNFYSISNDDHIYLTLSENIFKLHKITMDGVTNYVEMPPGYPVFLWMEKFFLLKYDNVFFFNFVILTTLTSLLIIIFYCRNFSRGNSAIFTPIALLYPIFITSNKLLSTSSEYIYSFLLWLGIFFLYEYLFFRPKKIYLFLISTLFSVIYLIRPEGLLFLTLSFFAILYLKRKSLCFKDILTFILPAIIFILPYMYFLLKTLGYITISGKLVYIVSLTKLRHADKFSLYIYNLKRILLLFASPNFINPLVSICLLYYLLIFRNFDREKRIKSLLLLIFSFSMIMVLIRYFIWARAIYPVIPALLIITGLSITHIIKKYRLKSAYLATFLTLYMFFCNFLPMFKSDFSNDPFLYKKAGIFIKNNFGADKVIMSRGKTDYYAEARGAKFNDKNITPDFIVVSNLTHISLKPADNLESINLFQEKFMLNGNEYTEIKRYGNNKYFVKIFKKR